MASITSANSTLSLAIANLYSSPQIIQGFSTDDAFMVDPLDMAEVMMGVDGRMSAGRVFNPVKMTITLQADSRSVIIFDTWANTQQGARELYWANGSIYLPSVGKKYVLQNGVLTTAKLMPDVKKLLQPLAYNITWEAVYGEVA